MNRKEKAVGYRQAIELKFVIGNGMQIDRIRKRVAITCLIAFAMSFSLGESLHAGQRSASVDSKSHCGSGSLTMADTLVGNPDWVYTATPIAAAAATLITITLLAHNLATSGKRGWGWASLCVCAGVLMIAVRLAVSIFQEVSSANSIADWDD